MTTSEGERELILQREVPFARELVWRALTEPEHQNKWWGPDGTRYPNHSVFKEIRPPSRLVFDHGDGQRVWFEATVTLQESATRTLITLRQLYPSRASRDEVVTKYGALEGAKQHLAKLEAYLKAQVARRCEGQK